MHYRSHTTIYSVFPHVKQLLGGFGPAGNFPRRSVYFYLRKCGIRLTKIPAALIIHMVNKMVNTMRKGNVTPRQESLLKSVEEFILEHGLRADHPPDREPAGIASPSAAFKHVPQPRAQGLPEARTGRAALWRDCRPPRTPAVCACPWPASCPPVRPARPSTSPAGPWTSPSG